MIKTRILAAGLATMAVGLAIGCAGNRDANCPGCVEWQQGQGPYATELQAQEATLRVISEEIRDQKKLLPDTAAARRIDSLQAKYAREEAVWKDIKKSADTRTDQVREQQGTGAVRKQSGKDFR